MRFIPFSLKTVALILVAASALGACTATTTSANPPGSQAGDRTGVTVFGTVDAGVGGVK